MWSSLVRKQGEKFKPFTRWVNLFWIYQAPNMTCPESSAPTTCQYIYSLCIDPLQNKLRVWNKTWTATYFTYISRYSYITKDTISPSTLSIDSCSNYWAMAAYNNSKLCNILFGEKLATLWYKHKIAVFILHPGNMIYTDISRYWWPYRVLFTLVRPFTKSLVSKLNALFAREIL